MDKLEHIGIAVKKSDLEADAWSAFRWSMLYGISLSGMSLLFAGIVAKSLTGPMSTIRNLTPKVLDDPSIEIGDAPPELAAVWQTLQRAAAERNEREQRIELLLREVNHRTKNMLAVVQSMARQTAAKSPDEFMERFSQRLQSLSINQDLLIKNDWTRIGIEELIDGQLAHLGNVSRSRISTEGPALALTPPTAQGVGLAVFELATNSLKYGALSGATGRVDVSWRIEGIELEMRWREHGGPPVEPPDRRGFGTSVITTLAAAQTSGTSEILYPASGIVWCLRCPVAVAIAVV